MNTTKVTYGVDIDSVLQCIDDNLAVLIARLEAKQPMHHPDAEWNAIMQTCESLRASKRDIARYVAHNGKSKPLNPE